MRILLPLALACSLVACGGDESTSREELVVSAAASLGDVFTEIETVFEDDNPDVDVILNLAGSSTLREQILEGSPVGVFASADVANMKAVADAGVVVGAPEIFARNRLQIVVPVGNPGGVDGLEDFADETLLIGLCSEGVPCGHFARTALAEAGVVPSVDSNEPDARALLTKIAEGELDAGITYVTDVVSSGGTVEGIDLPEEVDVVAEYSIAALTGGATPDAAAAFIDFVLSGRGQELLRQFGFSSP